MKGRGVVEEFARDPQARLACLVLGAESSGTHMVTELLISAGCIGHAGDHVDWQIDERTLAEDVFRPWESVAPTDQQPWDRELPSDQSPIVWRRSIPHGGDWVDITGLIRVLEGRGYSVRTVVVTRDRHATIRSQLKWHHAATAAAAADSIDRATRHIFAHLQGCAPDFIQVAYESLVRDPGARESLLLSLGLEVPARLPPVRDANAKWETGETGERREASRTAVEEMPVDGFPEWSFACDHALRRGYLECAAKGLGRMRESKVVLCGLARDVERHLEPVIARIERLGDCFADYAVAVYESDSRDGTAARLQRWRRENARVAVLSEVLRAPVWPQSVSEARMLHMAACRNRCLELAGDTCSGADFVIVLDMDLPQGFSYQGLASTFGHADWDVVGSNSILFAPAVDMPLGRREFFDAWAFRTDAYPDASTLREVNELRFERGEPLVPVRSCFGGLCVYRAPVFFCGERYGGGDCEHVVFNERLRGRGYDRQFLNPSQIVLYTGADKAG